jgi:hypothetical protein
LGWEDEMKFKKLLALGLMAGLVVGSLGVAEAAKRRKIVKFIPTEQSFFLRWDGTADTCGEAYLSIEDGEDLGNGCEAVAQPAQEVLIATEQGITRDWPARDGVPFLLNATKPITGTINIFQAVSVGGSLEIVLSGTTGGELVEIGTATADVPTTPMDITPVEFEVTPAAELNKKKFTSFNLNTTQRGVAVSYIEMEDPTSSLVLPTYKKKVIWK